MSEAGKIYFIVSARIISEFYVNRCNNIWAHTNSYESESNVNTVSLYTQTYVNTEQHNYIEA